MSSDLPLPSATISVIPAHLIVAHVKEKVRTAQSCIKATELLMPRPAIDPTYLRAVATRLAAGVTMRRILFGSATRAHAFHHTHAPASPHYLCRLLPAKTYQRMLLIDERHLFFAITHAKKPIFFYTQDAHVIKEFEVYFEVSWEMGRPLSM